MDLEPFRQNLLDLPSWPCPWQYISSFWRKNDNYNQIETKKDNLDKYFTIWTFYTWNPFFAQLGQFFNAYDTFTKVVLSFYCRYHGNIVLAACIYTGLTQTQTEVLQFNLAIIIILQYHVHRWDNLLAEIFVWFVNHLGSLTYLFDM